MKFKTTKIPGCYVIEPEPFTDNRGILRRHFDADSFRANGIESKVKQSNVSENYARYTLRGFHYQKPPNSESRTISCLRGSVHNMVVDLRPRSRTFLKWHAFVLDEKNRLSLHVPRGCANAFLTLEPNTVVHYYHSANYRKDAQGGIRYNDPLFSFVWPHKPEIISEKDTSWPNFVVK